MATIIQMPVQRSSRSTTTSRASHGAAILFFTGIRYVRDVSPELPAAIASGQPQAADTRAVM